VKGRKNLPVRQWQTINLKRLNLPVVSFKGEGWGASSLGIPMPSGVPNDAFGCPPMPSEHLPHVIQCFQCLQCHDFSQLPGLGVPMNKRKLSVERSIHPSEQNAENQNAVLLEDSEQSTCVKEKQSNNPE